MLCFGFTVLYFIWYACTYVCIIREWFLSRAVYLPRVHANEQTIRINMHSTAYSAYIDIYSRIGMQLLSFAVAVHYLSPLECDLVAATHPRISHAKPELHWNPESQQLPRKTASHSRPDEYVHKFQTTRHITHYFNRQLCALIWKHLHKYIRLLISSHK